VRAVLATGNAGKAAELSRLLELEIEARDLDVDETGESFAENALLKARAGAADGAWGLGDDSGLEVHALGGEPGVRSARWAGPSDADRNAALLARLAGVEDRRAAFVCVLAAVAPDGRELVAEGRLEGTIGLRPEGDGGFGYDPVFLLPDGRSVAQLTRDEKNAISHRGQAARALRAKLPR
jgi:XTP/dITP diphosphohydrolase